MAGGKGRSDPQEIERRGILIAGAEGQVRRLRSKRWEVAAQSVPGRAYEVVLTDGGFRCGCAYHAEWRGRRCKHIAAVEFILMQEAEAAAPGGEKRIAAPGPACPRCKTGSHCRDGIRRCRRRGPVQRFRCRSCGRRFSGNPGFEGSHFSPLVITMALAMFAFGLSPDAISQIWKMAGTRMHPATLQR